MVIFILNATRLDSTQEAEAEESHPRDLCGLQGEFYGSLGNLGKLDVKIKRKNMS